jgi:hypothetical protein
MLEPDKTTEEAQHSEPDRVEAWRLQTLIEAGYPFEHAELIAISDADLHRAVELLRKGCAPELAVDILI